MVLRAIAVFPLLTNTACLPVLVGGLILKSSKSKAEKREFITQLQNTNMERERQGLKPLDVCSEKYKFDQGWAERIVARRQVAKSQALPRSGRRASSPAPGNRLASRNCSTGGRFLVTGLGGVEWSAGRSAVR